MDIKIAIHKYLEMVSGARAEHTARAYKNGLAAFCDAIGPAQNALIETLTENLIADFARDLKSLSPATEVLYLQAVKGFYQYVDGERLADINMSRVKNLIHQRARRLGFCLPQFPTQDIDKIISLMENQRGDLATMRDRAFIITLADTGLRVHEACKLTRGNINFQEMQGVITGKGNKQAVIRYSARSISAIRDYLSMRSILDGATGRQLTSLPVFARHDKGTGRKIKPITTTTGRTIISNWVYKLLGEDAKGTITPHSFRHYFVTVVLQATGNLKMAQNLARHSNIEVTQRYAHLSDDELDQGYLQVFGNERKQEPK